MKVAIYCRLSEEDRNKQNKNDDSNSIKNQKAMLMQYALDHEWEVHDIYSDDDYTGADRNRPQFKRLLADAEAHKFDIILCKTQSRFTRELELVEKYIHGLFPLWGIRFISIVDNADTANKGNKKSRQINGLINEWYLEDMSDNIRSVLANRRENGFHVGPFAPYGYLKDPEKKGHLIIDPDAAAIVKEIFSLFADGYGKSTIAARLNDRGVPSPAEYKRQKGLLYKSSHPVISKLWRYDTIKKFLLNEVYIGTLVQGKSGSVSYKTKEIRARPESEWVRVPNTHEPIIDIELWKQVQAKVTTHARPISSNGQVHALSGKVFCINCGGALGVYNVKGYRYLQCRTPQYSKSACSGAFIPLHELESIVLKELRTLSNELMDQDRVQREVQFKQGLSEKKKRVEDEKIAFEKKNEEYSKALQELYLDKVRGIITPKDYLDMSEAFSADRSHLEILIAQCQERIDEIDTRISAGDNRLEIINQYLSQTELTKSMCEALIDHVEVGKRDKETGSIPVSIFWNF